MQVTASAVDNPGPAPAGLARLADRAVIAVTGPDAEHLLQGILTQDVARLSHQPAVFAGLLSPQGKILFDFFLARGPDGLLIDVAADRAVDLVKRLTLYRLRAKAAFADRSADMAVLVAWGEAAATLAVPAGAVAFPDPRLPALGLRILVPAAAAGMADASAADWHAHRIGLGVPEGGKDYAFGDAFPHEADMDQLAGLSFDKGCYVGQEVVSRMQHRATARKRIVLAKAGAPIPPGAVVMAGSARIGAVGTAAGHSAVVLVRLDRAAEALAKGETIAAGGVALTLEKPPWASFALAPPAREDEAP
ncbi:MAG: folate-binding protein [Hyphomicrobiaceae bacterium]|nr:folate-binding protein [Hyphomicrobiaceae bacterium]